MRGESPSLNKSISHSSAKNKNERKRTNSRTVDCIGCIFLCEGVLLRGKDFAPCMGGILWKRKIGPRINGTPKREWYQKVIK